MLERLMITTRLKREWAEKCLAENHCDFQKALEAFSILSQNGQISQQMLQQ